MNSFAAKAAIAFALTAPADGDYAGASARAVAAGRPLVVFVGQPAQPIDGCECVQMKTFPGVVGVGVVVGLPDGNGGLDRAADLTGIPDKGVIQSRTRRAAPVAVPVFRPVIRAASPLWGAANCGPAGCGPNG